MSSDMAQDWVGCRRCPRLVDYMATLAPKKGYARTDYHNGPVSGFGDPQARICLVGLAPGAHGANRTGRPFTGDGAGDFMYPLLYRAGFSNQPEISHAGDGLALKDLYITNAVKCVPPENKPIPAEFANCRGYLSKELASLARLKAVVCLGQGAFTSYLRLLKEQGAIDRLSDYPFGHEAVYHFEAGVALIASYHTSRYNVQTGRITQDMFLSLLHRVKGIVEGENG